MPYIVLTEELEYVFLCACDNVCQRISDRARNGRGRKTEGGRDQRKGCKEEILLCSGIRRDWRESSCNITLGTVTVLCVVCVLSV